MEKAWQNNREKNHRKKQKKQKHLVLELQCILLMLKFVYKHIVYKKKVLMIPVLMRIFIPLKVLFCRRSVCAVGMGTDFLIYVQLYILKYIYVYM